MGEGLGKIKYGWKRCKKLRDETEGTLGDRSPQKNADSLALLGSGKHNSFF